MTRFAALGVLVLYSLAASATSPDEEAVRMADTKYWDTYNGCDLKAMGALLTADAEFYHDKSGLTTTRDGIVDSIRTGICGDPALRVRRQEVSGSTSFHPLAGDFAYLEGKHQFFIKKTGRDEYLDGQASFAVVWQKVDGNWMMRRVVSFDHGPAPYAPPAHSIHMSAKQLGAFAGHFVAPQDGDIDVSVEGDHLRLKASHVDITIYPDSSATFFAEERALRFAFSDNNATLTVIEQGGPVAVAKRPPSTK